MGYLAFTCRLSQAQAPLVPGHAHLLIPKSARAWGLSVLLFVHEIPGHGKKAMAQRGGYPGLHQAGPGPGLASLVASRFCHIFPATNLSACKCELIPQGSI